MDNEEYDCDLCKRQVDISPIINYPFFRFGREIVRFGRVYIRTCVDCFDKNITIFHKGYIYYIFKHIYIQSYLCLNEINTIHVDIIVYILNNFVYPIYCQYLSKYNICPCIEEKCVLKWYKIQYKPHPILTIRHCSIDECHTIGHVKYEESFCYICLKCKDPNQSEIL